MGVGGFDSPESVPPVGIPPPSQKFVATPLGSSVVWQTHGILRAMHVTETKLAFHIEFISGS